MSIENFSAEFADAIEVDADQVEGGTVFKDIDIWDSLAVLTVIAMVDARYGKTITGDDLAKTATVSELYALVESKSKN